MKPTITGEGAITNMANDMEQQDTTSTNTEQTTTEENITEGAEATSSAAEASTDAGTQNEGAETDETLYEEINGKKYVPAEAYDKLKNGVQARIDAMTAKSKSVDHIVQEISNNPEVRTKLLESLGIEQADADEEVAYDADGSASKDSSAASEGGWQATDAWLNSIQDPAHKAFYTNFAKTFLSDIDRNVASFVEKKLQSIEAKYDKLIKPMMRWVGEISVKDFSTKNPDFVKYRGAIDRIMRESGVTLDKAYKIAKYDDLQRQLAALQGGKKKQPEAPIAGRQTAKAGSTKSDKMSLDEALAESIRELSGRK